MGRGRQKGQTKIMSKIKDSALGHYELWLEEDQIVLVDAIKEKSLSVIEIPVDSITVGNRLRSTSPRCIRVPSLKQLRR